MQPHQYEHLPMILVSGQARSGTTIVTKAVGAHPSVFSNQRESNYIRDVVGLLQANLSNPSRIKQMLESDRYFVSKFRTALYDVLFPLQQLNVCEPMAVSTFSSLNAGSADFLKELFPKLFILNVVRNGIEVVASRLRHSKIGRFSFEAHCRAWADSIFMAKWGAEKSGFVIFRHEDLRAPETTIQTFAELFGLVGLPESDAPANFVLDNRVSLNTGDDSDLEARHDRWQEWSTSEREQFELICGEAMSYFGYEVPWVND